MDKFEKQILEAIKDGLMFSIRDSQIVSILMSDIKDEISELLYAHCNMVQDESKQNVGTEINVSYDSGEKDEETCPDMMEFPDTFDKFAEDYGFKDSEEVYTNGSDLIPVFRVKQWLEQDKKLRKAEIETAYECGKHASKWIPVSESMPEGAEEVLFCDIDEDVMIGYHIDGCLKTHFVESGTHVGVKDVKAWMPLPEAYKAGEMTKADDVLDRIKDEIAEEFGGCAICEYDEDYDWDENDISEWQKVGSINDILEIIDKHKKGEKEE